MQPDWNDVHHFTVLVERETLTAAAEALNVQHSTVSRRIERLEQTLGLRLFDRIGKRYLLPEDGARLYQHARGLATDMQQLGRIARETVQAMSKVIVSAPPLIAKGLLMPHFAEFRRRQPRICLTLHSEVQLSNLHRRQADIAPPATTGVSSPWIPSARTACGSPRPWRRSKPLSSATISALSATRWHNNAASASCLIFASAAKTRSARSHWAAMRRLNLPPRCIW